MRRSPIFFWIPVRSVRPSTCRRITARRPPTLTRWWPRCAHASRYSRSAHRTGTGTPRPRRSAHWRASRRTGPTDMGRWRSNWMAAASSSAPARPTFLLLGDEPFRARLRRAELVSCRVADARTESAGLVRWPGPDLGTPLGVTRHDARSDSAEAILMSGASQGLFAAVDDRRVVIVEHAEALRSDEPVRAFPPDAALVLDRKSVA